MSALGHTRRSFNLGLSTALLPWLGACSDPKSEIKDIKSALTVAYGQKKFQDVLTLAQKGYELSSKVQGDKHPDTLYFAQSISEALEELGNRKAAIGALAREIKLRLAAGQSERKIQGRRTLAIQFAEETGDKESAAMHAVAIARDIGMDKSGAEPQPVYRPETSWPLSQVDKEVQADVTLAFDLDETGAVMKPRVVKSTNAAFDSTALDNFKKWRFTPALKGTQAVDSSGHEFTLMFRRPRKN